MKLYKRIKMGWMGLLPALAITLGLAAAPLAQAGISGTKHNLSTSGTQSNHMTGATVASQAAEICVFCHTPHGASTTNKAPLWNKGTTGATYTTYSSASSSTIDGNVSMANSVSLGCLSCHDGTQAMDNMINAPGSGGYNASGARLAGAAWTGAGADGLMPDGIGKLGSDLSNDHPVAIQYCGGGLSGSTNTVSGTCADGDFKDGGDDVKTKLVGTTQVFWVDTGTPASREKTDLPLYNNSGNTGPSVECATCHDPHSDAQTTFLRISNAASTVCLTCHVK